MGISGFRADLGVADDLFGSREDAWSETVRQSRWEWWLHDYSARLKPGAKRVLISTRWHMEDVAGRILDQVERGEIKGRVISIPAVAEQDDPLGRAPGGYLWDDDPNYAYGDFLRARQRETSPMMWAALYQQRPAPEEGDYFKIDWLKPVDGLPPLERMRTYAASDFAVTSSGGDFTVHLVVGLDPAGKMYLCDVWRKQSSSDVWVEAMIDMAAKWRPLAWACERGQILSAMGPLIERRMRERSTYVRLEHFASKFDKSVRSRSIQGRMALEGLYVPADAHWHSQFRSELLSFPAGKYDDQVDALGLVGQLLDQMVKGRAPKPLESRVVNTRRMTWDERFRRHQRNLARERDGFEIRWGSGAN